jgi:RimJ/RimL family protein N-acetyltransferase
MTVEIRSVDAGDSAALRAFVDAIPEGDRTFFKEDVGDPRLVESWLRPGSERHAVATEGDEIVGFAAIVPLHGWSAHVGELRLIVAPAHRGRGVGGALARRAVLEALDVGLTRVVVEIVADQEALVAMFESLGFRAEALLRDHIRDRSGELRDLIVLAHSVPETWSVMATAGIPEAL